MIEEQLVSQIQSLVGGRVYPLQAPDKPVAPFIVYQNIANTPEVVLDGPIPINNTRMQIDCYAKTYAEVKTLFNNLVAAMAAASFTNIQSTSQDIFEQEVKLYRVQVDYSIWY